MLLPTSRTGTLLRSIICAAAALLVIAPATANAEAITGQVSVIDGDTIEIHGTRIRLHGIDAPESAQHCTANEKQFRCGQLAAMALSDKIGSQTVSCEARDTDRYGRIVGVCRASGEDLNAWMVAEGWAMAYREYSTDYVNHENAASASKRGLWKTEFMPPWEWRRVQRAEAAEPKPQHGQQPECSIKGNISRSGERIYHVPGGQYYGATQVNTSKDERWFCSEAEARAAGWRRSKR
jgi:endonuclease YncB( thermonuclease family)